MAQKGESILFEALLVSLWLEGLLRYFPINCLRLALDNEIA